MSTRLSFSKKISLALAVAFFASMLLFSFEAFALEAPGGAGSQTPGGAGSQTPGGAGTQTPGGSRSDCGHGDAPGALINPLKACDIPEFLIALVDVLIIFATPIIVIYIMYAGFKFVTAQGNPSEIESARTALLWAVVGGVIVLGAKLILVVIKGTIAAFGV